MKITKMKIFPINKDHLKAYVTITLNDYFIVHNLKIIQGPGDLFITIPSKKHKNNQFKNIAHPLNQNTHTIIKNMIFETYENELKSINESLDSFKHQKAPYRDWETDRKSVV